MINIAQMCGYQITSETREKLRKFEGNTRRESLLKKHLDKYPALNPAWDLSTQRVWLDGFEQILDICLKHCQ